jgi:hypothetical protein
MIFSEAQANLKVKEAKTMTAFFIGFTFGVFCIAMFAARSYEKGYEDGRRS